MGKKSTLLVLTVLLAAVSLSALAISRRETRQEQIRNYGQTILAVPPDSINRLSWDVDGNALSFRREDERWVYEEDAAFPVNQEKLNALAAVFEDFPAAFQIEQVEDYSQYGLSQPMGTITLETADGTTILKLGDFSQMDSQRYLTVNDTDVYLVSDDPAETFDVSLHDLIQNDITPYIAQADSLEFSGSTCQTITYHEDGGSLLSEDVYYMDGKPLDSQRIRSLLDSVSGLDLTDYATYQASAASLSDYGMDTPELSITICYPQEDSETGETAEASFTLHVSRNAQELEKARQSDSGDETGVAAYARVGNSEIIYNISYGSFQALTQVSYNDLRHTGVFAADFSSLREIRVELEGETCLFQLSGEDADAVWMLEDSQVDMTGFNTKLNALSVTEFLEESPSDKQEISLRFTFENGQTREISLCRRDSDSCLALVDGNSLGLVSREDTLALKESVNTILLKAES